MELDKNFYPELKEKIMPYFDINDDLHGWSHTQRVIGNAENIMGNCFSISFDRDVVKTSAYLHDIARKMEIEGKVGCHAKEGAKISEQLLGEMKTPSELIEPVSYAISVHRVSNHINPQTIEAKILQDADRLDALGAIIIARCFDYSSKKGRPYFVEGVEPKEFYDGSTSASTIHHMQEKILKLTPDKFHTSTARGIAIERYNFVKEFVNRFISEWRGEA